MDKFYIKQLQEADLFTQTPSQFLLMQSVFAHFPVCLWCQEPRGGPTGNFALHWKVEVVLLLG